MKGKICIVTGSNSGIGKETALALTDLGAIVIMAVRNWERGEGARKEIIEKTGSTKPKLMLCDLSSMASVRQFAQRFLTEHDRLDVLINNAGAVFSRRQTTVDGFEQTLAVNYLGPFLLTHKLLPLLTSSAPSRIINLSSGLLKSGTIDFTDLQYENNYNGMRVYANAKLMIAMYTYELARRLAATGVTVNVVLPGFVATNLGRNSGNPLQSLMFKMMRPFQISARKGAETSIFLASSDEILDVTGKCFEKKHVSTTSQISYDAKLQARLLDTTFKLLDLEASLKT